MVKPKAPAKKKAAKKPPAEKKAAKPVAKEAPTKKHPGGRPPKYTDAAVFQAKVDQYFQECEEKQTLPGIHGLAVALDMCRDSILAYGDKEEFSGTIKKAKEKLRLAWESRLAATGSTGAIFWLKNNAGWKDQQDVKTELTGKGGGPVKLEWTVRFETAKPK